ncbi:DUF928 domain-containing protein [Argonema antarcticum A004/B2]|nr:DUF928 domain-containing protein [Argonema antarcticum A004/B2]
MALLCDRNHPSTAIFSRAEIPVVEMPPALRSELSKVKESSQIVELYARSGLWYDALREVRLLTNKTPRKQRIVSLRCRLCTLPPLVFRV